MSNSSDANKLLFLAYWLDYLQCSNKFPQWSSSREVQEDLRRIAKKVERYDEIMETNEKSYRDSE